eukprot:123211-Chlamydomonas_euryale.AAC.1
MAPSADPPPQTGEGWTVMTPTQTARSRAACGHESTGQSKGAQAARRTRRRVSHHQRWCSACVQTAAAGLAHRGAQLRRRQAGVAEVGKQPRVLHSILVDVAAHMAHRLPCRHHATQAVPVVHERHARRAARRQG